MAAISPLTGLVAQAELVPAEKINEVLQAFNLPPVTYKAVGWFVAGQGSVPQKFVRFKDLNDQGTPGVPANPKAESDTFTVVNQETEEESLTPVIPGFSVFISDELVGSGVKDIPAVNLAKFVQDMENRKDLDFHLAATTLTDSGGLVTDEATAAWMRARFVDFRALDAAMTGAGAGLVLHQGPWGALERSLMNTAAPLPVRGLEAEMFGPQTGFMGSIQGFKLFATNNVAASTSGKANYITSLGMGVCALGGAISEEIFVESVRGSDGARRRGTWHNVSAYYQMGKVAPQNGLLCKSAAA